MKTMVKIPMRFNRVAAAFDEASRGRGTCESSGSEHSAAEDGSPDNLSDLVASFMEKEGNAMDLMLLDEEIDRCNTKESSEARYGSDNFDETADALRDLLGCNNNTATETIRTEVELAHRSIGDKYGYASEDFKRRLMSRLRERGFDAGLCKSRWEKSGQRPAGDYQYVDIIDAKGDRYIVEVYLAACFEIARPTDRYASLLSLLPATFVGRAEELKRLVRLMCGAMKRSLKCSELTMPPWRRNAYMQSKWLGPYKRTTNKAPTGKGSENLRDEAKSKKSVGFVAIPRGPYRCRDECSNSTRMRVGQLTATFCHN